MSATPQIEVISPGAYASLQDRGRRGYRRVGVPWAGVLDPHLMRIANALVGNADDTPVIECFDGGLQLVARGAALRLAVAGETAVEVISAGERRVLEPWRSLVLADGESLRLRRMEAGRIAVVAIEGLVAARMLGSASTYARAGLGGVDGRALMPGTRLSALAASPRREQMLPDPPRLVRGPIRVVAGPQADHFAESVLAGFAAAEYKVTSDADRMGVRLEGPPLVHQGAREITSDATVSGSIQVPGNGQPIVLLADAQTAGGYPKIATVISADLPRLAASRPGQVLQFAFVDAGEGEALARAAEAAIRARIATICPLMVGGVDEAALYSCNLVTGFLHALSTDYRPAADDPPPRAPN